MFLLECDSCFTLCRYERVLVDAPCSSDRHLANAPLQLAQWSQTHVAQAAALQVLLKLRLTLF
jgi:16S rRNA C967 or C1407 C5-methylase (RsmB/RsmF family)